MEHEVKIYLTTDQLRALEAIAKRENWRVSDVVFCGAVVASALRPVDLDGLVRELLPASYRPRKIQERVRPSSRRNRGRDDERSGA